MAVKGKTLPLHVQQEFEDYLTLPWTTRGAVTAQLRRARANLRQEEVRLREELRCFSRLQKLAAQGAASAEQLEEAKLYWETASAVLEVAKADLRLAQVAAVLDDGGDEPAEVELAAAPRQAAAPGHQDRLARPALLEQRPGQGHGVRLQGVLASRDHWLRIDLAFRPRDLAVSTYPAWRIARHCRADGADGPDRRGASGNGRAGQGRRGRYPWPCLSRYYEATD